MPKTSFFLKKNDYTPVPCLELYRGFIAKNCMNAIRLAYPIFT